MDIRWRFELFSWLLGYWPWPLHSYPTPPPPLFPLHLATASQSHVLFFHLYKSGDYLASAFRKFGDKQMSGASRRNSYDPTLSFCSNWVKYFRYSRPCIYVYTCTGVHIYVLRQTRRLLHMGWKNQAGFGLVLFWASSLTLPDGILFVFFPTMPSTNSLYIQPLGFKILLVCGFVLAPLL